MNHRLNRWHYLAEKGPDLAAQVILIIFIPLEIIRIEP